MSSTTGPIQPVASAGPWVAPETQNKEVQSVTRVAGTEGGTASKVGEFAENSGANIASADQGFSAGVVEQIQSFLQENLGIELNFIANGNKTIVQVINKKTGKVIREIPPEKVARFRDKEEALRGILFDGEA
jgi:uncharacterized FlaG/YvyC family protein